MTVTVFQQANQLFREGKLEEAVIVYQKAITQNPQFYGAYQNLGEALGKLGRLDEAVKMYRKAIELKPSADWLHQELGLLLEKLEKKQDAIELDNKASNTKPGLQESERNLESALHGEVEVHEEPQSAEDCYHLANALYNSANWKEAITYYRQLINTDLDSAVVHRRLGYALAQEQRWKEAVVEYRQALDLHSSVEDAYQDIGDFQDTEIYFFPDYRTTNSYQNLLYSHPPNGCTIKVGDLDLALQVLKHSLTPKKVVFHLHWTSFVLAPAKNVEEAEDFKNSFLTKLFDFLLEGGAFIWTIHNVLPHYCLYQKQEIELRTVLAAVASKIHFHSQKSIQEVTEVFPLQTAKIQIIHHGNYIGSYPNYVNRTHARQRFGYLPEDLVFLFLGQIRPYKGLDDLILAFNKVQKKFPNTYLLIAGDASYPTKKGTTTAKAKLFTNITVVEEHIPDDELQWFYATADVVVLPYKRILTSGSALGALSFSRPVIAPDVGMIKEIIQDGKNGFTYHLGDINSLEKAMLMTAKLSCIEREALFNNARASVEKLRWNHHVKLLLSDIKTLKPCQNIINLYRKKIETSLKSDLNIIETKIKTELSEINCKIWNPLPKITESGKVAIVILNYNTTDDAAKLINSLKKSTYKNFYIIIVDNESSTINLSELIDKFHCATIIRTSKNLGYAGGNNVGIQYIKDKGFDFVWILNPDTIVNADSLEKLVIAAQQYRDISIYGSVIFWGEKPDIVWYGGAVVEFSDSNFQTYHMYSGKHKSLIPNTIYEVDYVAGTSLFCRTQVFNEVGLIPEHYFLYFEETDWCLRARKAGHRVAVIPSSQIYHTKRSQVGSLPTKTYFYYYIRASVLFILKYFSQDSSLIVSSIKNKFIQPWLDRIGKKAPQHTAYFTALAEKALEDGLSGVTGWVDLKQVLEQRIEHLLPSEKIAIYGCLENVNAQKISGWVYNQNQPQERLKVTISIDGKVEAFVIAEKYRKDIQQLGYGDGYYGFEVETPKTLYDFHPHTIEAFVEDSISLKTNISQPFQYKLNRPEYKGRIDGISANRSIQGWALDLNNPYRLLTVEILDGNKVVAIAKCNQERPDVKKAGYPTAIAGFSALIPIAYCEGKEHYLSVRVAGTLDVLYTCKVKMQTGQYPVLSSASSIEDLLRKLYYYREISMVHQEHRESIYLKELQAITHKLTQEFIGKPQSCLASVIMPTYNREKTIQAALDSVISQSYQNWELIIVDDGSTDNTVQIVKEFISQHSTRPIALVELEKNSGVSIARNTGLAKARGEIIAYLDSDNTWEPEFLLIMVNTLIDNPWAQVAYCGDKIWQHYTGNTTLPASKELISVRLGPFNKSLIENRNYIDLNVFVHTREISEKLGGFRENMQRLVDWELIVRYTDFAAPKFVPALLANYNMDWSENQITRIENFDNNLVKIQETLKRIEGGEIRKLTSVNQGEGVQIAVIAGDCDFDTLNLCLQALVANTQLEKIKILVYLRTNSKIKVNQLISDLQELIDIKVNHLNSDNWSEVVSDAAKNLPEGFAMVVLSYEAVVSAGWLVALQSAAAGEQVGLVIPRQIVSGYHPKAQELVPYSRGFYDVDIALSSKTDSLLVPWSKDNQILWEISEFSCFCVYFNWQLIQSFDWDKLVKIKNIDWTREVSKIITTYQNMSIVYTPYSRVFDISYFN